MFFSNRKKKAVDLLQISDAHGAILFYGAARDFLLPENSVLQLSMEFFNDPSPCEIHRGAVRERAFQEILHACPEFQVYPITSLSARIRAFLSDYPDGCMVEHRKESRP